MSRNTIFFGVGLAAQLIASSLCGSLALLQAQEASPAAPPAPASAIPAAPAAPASATPASTTPAAPPSGHDAAIIRLRDIAYGKDEDGNFKEQSERVREAAKEALKQVVTQQVQEEEAMKAGANSQVATSGGSNAVTATNFNQAAPQPPGTNAGNAVATGAAPSGASSAANNNWFLPDLFDGHSTHRLTNYQEGPAPVQPNLPSPFQPNLPGTPEPGLGALALNNVEEQFGAIGTFSGAGATNAVAVNEASAGGQSTLGGILKESDSVQDVQTQERSGLSLDPHIRSYKWGQIYADVDGAYWSPARLDMDTMLSKIDPGMVSSVNVLSGPYGVRYGPGLAFFDVQRTPTPRYAECPETHLNSMFSIQSNGGRVSDVETISGGGADWGYRGSLGAKDGAAYRAGDGTLIPNAYHSTDEWGELGYDINPHQRLSFLYQREDQTGVQNPAQFFNTNYLGSYGFQVGLVDDDPTAPWTKLSTSAWYNRTRFNGDNSNEQMNNFPVMQFVNQSVSYQLGNPFPGPLSNNVTAQTEGNTYNAGARTGVVLGEKDCTQVRIGADYRYQEQFIGEQFQISGSGGFDFNTNMPQARMIDPGAYFELTQPVNDVWTFTAGARLDYVRTDANANQLRLFPGTTNYGGLLPGVNTTNPSATNLSDNDILYAFYATNNVKLGDHWMFDAGFGQGQRPPTLIERYADGLFISTLQTGFTHVVGDPNLLPERDWQVDLGLSSNYDCLHTRARFFQAWIQDYVTYSDIGAVNAPNGLSVPEARLVQFTNTSLATLTGFELAGDYDWDDNLTPFGKMSYVYGWDQQINAPLTGISPLEATIGIRIHDANHGKVWGIEPSARLVADQNHLGAIRELGNPNISDTVELPTASFVVCNVRGYYNYSKNLSFTAGVNNLFDENYLEHLDLRLQGPSGLIMPVGRLPVGSLPNYSNTLTRVLEPGISPYLSINWTF